MKKLIAIFAIALSALALTGCDDKSDDGRFESHELVENSTGHIAIFIDHYAHKYYFYNNQGGALLEISAAQAGEYADKVTAEYHEPTTTNSAPVQQPVAPVIINNRND